MGIIRVRSDDWWDCWPVRVDAAWRLCYRSGDEWNECALDEAAGVALEAVSQVRERKRFRGMKNKRGWYYFATTGDMCWCESRFDMRVLRLLDFDRDVVGIAVQPFVLHFRDDGGRAEHTPDVFARLADGTGKVIDVRPRLFAGSDDFLRKCAASRAACRVAGWDFEVVDGIDPVFEANVDWLAGCRHELVDPMGVAPAILAACVRPQPFGAIAEAFGPASLTRPVLCHLLWTGQLVADLSRPLGDATTVATSDALECRRAS